LYVEDAIRNQRSIRHAVVQNMTVLRRDEGDRRALRCRHAEQRHGDGCQQ
jgi:hypothetical protein